MKDLCKKFNLITREVLQAFRNYKDFGGKRSDNTLKTLFDCVKSLPTTTAACERGFSAMNSIATPSRSSLNVGTLAACMWLKLNGPPLVQFHPLCYVKSWLAKGRRSANNANYMQRQHEEDESANKGLWKLFA